MSHAIETTKRSATNISVIVMFIIGPIALVIMDMTLGYNA